MSGSIDLARLVGRAKGNIEQAVRQTVVLAAQGVVMNSPVDTGRLRASWNFSVGRPDGATSERVDKSGGATLNRIASAMQGQKPGPSFYIVTGLPYARRIEYEGYSQKAPQGMVGITLANLPDAIRRYVAGLQ